MESVCVCVSCVVISVKISFNMSSHRPCIEKNSPTFHVNGLCSPKCILLNLGIIIIIIDLKCTNANTDINACGKVGCLRQVLSCVLDRCELAELSWAE